VDKKFVQKKFNVLFSRMIIALVAGVPIAAFGPLLADAATEGREALMLEAKVEQGRETISGRVLLQAGSATWTSVADRPGVGRKPGLRLEARAVMIEPDVVEIETRILGSSEQNAKMIVRLGELAELNVAQMEGADAIKQRPQTNLGVKVLKVRF
jgi:hypothetical protein